MKKFISIFLLPASYVFAPPLYAGNVGTDTPYIVGSLVSPMIFSIVPKAGYFSENDISGTGYSIGPEIFIRQGSTNYFTQFAFYYSHIEMDHGRNLLHAKFQPTIFLSEPRFLLKDIPGVNPDSGIGLGFPVGFFFDGQGGASLGLAIEYYLPFCKLVLSYEAYQGLYSGHRMDSIQFGLRNPF